MTQHIDVEAVEVADNPAADTQLIPLHLSTTLAKFDPIRARLDDLKALAATTVYDINTKDGEETARMMRALCVKVRTDADKAYKIWNAPILVEQRGVRSLVEGIETEVKPIELVYDTAIKAKEKAVAAELQRLVELDLARIKALRAKITAIAGLPARAVSMTLEQLQAAQQDLLATVCDEAGFGEFADEASDLVGAISEQLAGMLTAVEARAAEAQRLLAAAQQLDLERQAQALATQRANAITEIRSQPLAMMGLPASVMDALIKTAEILEPSAEEFGEMLAEAEQAHVLALSQMRSLRDASWATERAAADLTIANAQAEQRRQQDAADAERRQVEAAASTKLLKDQQDAFEAEQIAAKAKVQAERDALALEKAEIAAMAAALAAPKIVAVEPEPETEVIVAHASTKESGLFEPEDLPLTSSFNTCAEIPATSDAEGSTALSAWIIETVMSEMQVSELDALGMLLDSRVQWAWTERRVELELNLSEIPS